MWESPIVAFDPLAAGNPRLQFRINGEDLRIVSRLNTENGAAVGIQPLKFICLSLPENFA